MKIVIFNVKYSENVGDGLLATCLEDLIRKALPGSLVQTIDLAGRSSYGETSSQRRRILGMLRKLPATTRRFIVHTLLTRKIKTLQSAWSTQIAQADAVVIGGGNLFQDDDLNFPTKIGAVLDIVCRQNVPLAVYGVGVSGHWSNEGKRLFEKLLDVRLFHCSVRDQLALAAFRSHFPTMKKPTVVADPGLAAAALAKADRSSISDRPMYGLCVTDPLILERHASLNASAAPVLSVDDYRCLVTRLINKGGDVTLFCNGAREDAAFIASICADDSMKAVLSRKQLAVAERPVEPRDLLEAIGHMDIVIAHRLHACIAAIALGIPAVGLDWDHKVRGFFEGAGLANNFVPSGVDPDGVATKARSVLQAGIDEATLDGLRLSVEASVRKLVSDLRDHMGADTALQQVAINAR